VTRPNVSLAAVQMNVDYTQRHLFGVSDAIPEGQRISTRCAVTESGGGMSPVKNQKLSSPEKSIL
jgi:hypothetical protein